MKILDFVNNLKAVERTDVLKTLNYQRDFLNGINENFRLLEAGGETVEHVLMGGWKNAPVLFKGIRGNLPSSITAQDIFAGAIGNIFQLLAVLEKDTSAGQKVISKETITVKEANALLLSSYTDLWINYFNRLMDAYTSMMVEGKSLEQVTQKVDQQFLTENLSAFCSLTYSFFTNADTLLKRYKALPKVSADEDTVAVLEGAKGKDSVNVLTVNNLAPHHFTPVYWWEYGKLELNLRKIERARLSIENNANKISYYQDLQRKEPSPANEKMIKMLQDRIVKAQAQIDDITDYYQ